MKIISKFVANVLDITKRFYICSVIEFVYANIDKIYYQWL